VISEIPEIGPYLGRLADAVRRFSEPGVGLDAVRLRLVTDLFERTQSAREFLLTGDEGGARAALDRGAWLDLWRRAARQAASNTSDHIAARIAAAGKRSGYPAWRVAALLPTEETRGILVAKVEAAGIPLENRLARGFPPGSDWWDAVRQAAVALEDSWEDLELVIQSELAAADPVVAQVGRWKPSSTPGLIVLAVGLVVSAWVGLALGGYLPRPTWLDPMNDRFWSLPWP
jgi:hypothetical protein